MNRGLLFIILITIFIQALLIFDSMLGSWDRLSVGAGTLSNFINEDVWPPDWGVFDPTWSVSCSASPRFDFTCSKAWIGLIETLQIAFVATVFGAMLSLPFSLLAARNLNPRWLSYSSRFLLASFRSMPSLIWAILFVIVIGFGPVSGVLAMTLYTVGYLGKLQYEAMEGMTKPPLDAANAIGLSKFETSFFVVIPESANDLISQAIFMFEYNFRHGTVIGIVGAGGIGYFIDLSLMALDYRSVLAYLILIYVVVIIIDLVSIFARSFFTEEEDILIPSWIEVFTPESIISLFKYTKGQINGKQ
tara:strand:+ start:2704 stop:3615 length:912 start_codon:yes stop_codon:yes gene_type:complete